MIPGAGGYADEIFNAPYVSNLNSSSGTEEFWLDLGQLAARYVFPVPDVCRLLLDGMS